MKRFGELINPPEKEGKEKHIPVIEAPAEVKSGVFFQVTVTVGKEVKHPNTVEHHIKWIQVYIAAPGKPLVHVGSFDLGPTYSDPAVTFPLKLEQSATLYALEYCNIHGVWDNAMEITVS